MDAFPLLRALAPFYHFADEFLLGEALVFDDKMVEHIFATIPDASYHPEHDVVVVSKKRLETLAATEIPGVLVLTIQEATRSPYTGGRVTWTRGTNELTPSNSVSLLLILRTARTLAIDEWRTPEDFTLVSHADGHLVLEMSIDNFSS